MSRLIALCTAVTLLAASCVGAGATGPGSPATGPRSGPGEGLTVVATVFGLGWIAAQVAPGAEHEILGARGDDPHDLELTPGDRALLERADVVLYVGELGFQPHVETVLGEREGVTVSARAVAGDGALLALDRDGEHDGETDHGDEGGHDGWDPHLWFDAAVMATVAEATGEALAEADPAGAEGYRARARALHDELAALDTELDATLDGCAHDTAIVSHEAYAYLLAPRGLAQEGISGAGGHGEASPRDLAELSERIRAESIPAVLAEPVEGRADAETLAREAGVEVLDIHPLETASAAEFARGYVALLREQGETFARALACG